VICQLPDAETVLPLCDPSCPVILATELANGLALAGIELPMQMSAAMRADIVMENLENDFTTTSLGGFIYIC
jgi:hypothetical protein